jgi:hypothetical protein
MALLAGLGFVTYSFLAMDPEPTTHAAAVIEPVPARLPSQSASSDATATPVQQPTPQPATANAEAPAGSATPAEPEQDEAKSDVIVHTVKVVDIDPPQVAKASPLTANPPREAPPNAVPSPVKKPAKADRGLGTGAVEQASSGATARTPETPHQNPMGLGPFGFNSAN